MNTSCAPAADAAFGPVVDAGCRHGFDFTLAFEQSVLVMLPAALLLLVAPLRLVRLGKAPVRVAGHRLRLLKLVAAGALAALQLALATLWATQPGAVARVAIVSLVAACVSFASSLMSCALSYAEHTRSPRPSSVLNVFLLVSLLLDAALLRTLWLSPSVDGPIRGVFTASFAVKAALVVLEAKQKSRYLLRPVHAPEEAAGLYGRAVFAWVAPLLRTGFRRLLRPADLFALDEQMTAASLSERFRLNWNKAPSQLPEEHQKHRLIICCIVTLRGPLLAVVVPRFVQLAFTVCQPLILNRFLMFLADETQADSVGYGLVGAYGLVYLGIAVSQALYWHCNGRVVTMLRGVLVTAIFSKATEISITATDNSAAVTLMSTDAEVIGRAMRQVNEFWANIIQIAIATWLLSQRIGYASAGPIIVSAVALTATLFVSPMAKKYRVGWLKKTQKRVGITSAMIGHIKSIKMSGLSQKLSTTIEALRLEEIKASRPFRLIGSTTSAIAQVPLLISPPVAFAIFQGVASQTGEVLDATRLFSSLSFIILLAQPLFWMFEAVLDLSAAFGAIERIQKFLVEKTRREYRDITRAQHTPLPHAHEHASSIEMQRLRSSEARFEPRLYGSESAVQIHNASFAWTMDKIVLKGVSFDLNRGHLAMLLGPVASGKTTLLKGLLSEVPKVTGHIRLVSDRLSWCDQSPWILNQTIRDNIVGYSSFDEQLYNSVIMACELEKDFRRLDQGDMTMVGSKGLALSGGQKQRVALARAVYSRPEIALFDDVFSGLDNHTAQKVFKNIFGSSGLLLKWRTTVVLATQKASFLPLADLIISLSQSGEISEIGSFSYLRSSGGYVQSLVSDKNSFSETRPVSEKEGHDEAPKLEYKANVAPEEDDKRRQLGDSTVYRYYFSSIGIPFAVTLLALEVGWVFLQSFSTVWLNFWAETNQSETNRNASYYLGIYSALQVVGVVWFAALIWFVLVLLAAKSGVSLHQRLLLTVMRAPLSLFTRADLGAITTRFSQDISMIDNNLPLALVVSLASFFSVLAKAGLLAASSYYVAISFPFLGILHFYLQRGYLRTSRQLRFLDLEEKAPVYTQFLETLSGLSTLRAFGWPQAAILKNHELVDKSQKPFYLLIMVQRWLVLVLDLTTTALALLVVGFAVYLRGSVSVGLTGVSLVQLISLSETLNMLIQFWTSIETSIGAVARIKQFAEENREENRPGEDQEPPADWPSQGHVVLSDVSASYGDSDGVMALDGITLDIAPGEKVAICGRTGSGKSTLLLALLRLLHSSTGTITVDAVSLSSLSRESVRTRLITVSQDQFVLPGSIRENIDPFDAYPLEAIEASLSAVGLWPVVEEHGGLDAQFDEDRLSHGQRQLFFVARAVLKRGVGKLVLLDEATSSVDRDTEEMVHRLIKSEFKEHTVLFIAHRLDSVLAYDRVVVLDQGRVVEDGPPRQLQQLRSSKFRALWEAGCGNTD